MRGGTLARRYVKPLFEVASENGEIERIAGDLAMLDKMLHDSADLRIFLSDPSYNRSVKKSVLEKLFQDASVYTWNFVRVVIDKNRPDVLKSAYRLFKEMVNLHRGILTGVVETAVPLDDAGFEQVKSILEAQFDKKLDLERKVEQELLGGLRVRVGNTVIDGSLQGRLAQLKAALVRG